MSAPAPAPRGPRIGWWLAVLILLVVAAAALVVGTAWNRQQSLIAQIEALQGQVETRPVGPAWLRQLVGEPRMRGWDAIIGINLADREVDDAWLERIRHLEDLEWIDLTNTKVTEQGLRQLAQLPNLKEIYLEETTVSDEALAALEKSRAGLTVIRGRKDPIATSLAMRRINRHAITFALFSPDDGHVVAGDGDGHHLVWDVASGRLLTPHTWTAADWAFDGTFTPDGRRLLVADGHNHVRILDALITDGPAEDTAYTAHTGDVHAVRVTPDGTQFVSAGDDMIVRVAALDSLDTLRELAGHTAAIPTLAISLDGRTLATGSRDATVRLWDLASGECLHVLDDHTDDVHSVAFSPDGRVLATASYDRTIKLRDAATGETRRTLCGHDDWVFTVAFHPDGSLLASGSGDGTVRLWDIETGDQRRVLRHQRTISRVAFSHDGALLASSAAEGNVCLWNVADGTLRRVLSARSRALPGRM
jgi:WD40 repeat protein